MKFIVAYLAILAASQTLALPRVIKIGQFRIFLKKLWLSFNRFKVIILI